MSDDCAVTTQSMIQVMSDCEKGEDVQGKVRLGEEAQGHVGGIEKETTQDTWRHGVAICQDGPH